MNRPRPRINRKLLSSVYIALEQRALLAALFLEPGSELDEVTSSPDLTTEIDKSERNSEGQSFTWNLNGLQRSIEPSAGTPFISFYEPGSLSDTWANFQQSAQQWELAGDSFGFDIPDDYQGEIRFELSQLTPSNSNLRISLVDRTGQVIDSAVDFNSKGKIEISVSGRAGERLTLLVEGDAGGAPDSYELLVQLVESEQTSPEVILRVSRGGASSGGGSGALIPGMGQDRGADQSLVAEEKSEATDQPDEKTAIILEIGFGYNAFSQAKHRGNLLSADDVDVYQVKVGSFKGGFTPALNLSVRRLQANAAAPKVRVLDAQGESVDCEVIAVAAGEFSVRVRGSQAEANYRIEVSAEDPAQGDRSDYELTISRSPERASVAERFEGKTDGHGPVYHTLQLLEPQSLSFAWQVPASAERSEALLWATIYDSAGKVVYRGANVPLEGQAQSATYIAAGNYRVEILAAGDVIKGLAYTLLARAEGDRQGPELADSSKLPFDRKPLETELYPGDKVTDATFLFYDQTHPERFSPPPGP
jgi:hypothetical protein